MSQSKAKLSGLRRLSFKASGQRHIVSDVSKPKPFKFFSRKAFEHLLFELHPSAYREIDNRLCEFDDQYPGALDGISRVYELNFENPTSQGEALPPGLIRADLPAFDINVLIDADRIGTAKKFSRLSVTKQFSLQGSMGQQANSNHIIVKLVRDRHQNTYIIPLPLVAQAFESRVCRPNTYQVYQHTLIRKPSMPASPHASTEELYAAYLAGAGEYVGITSRTWQQRSKEHDYAADRGSMLLFHRALRGDLFDVGAHEHIVLRAGLSRGRALYIEEREVEERTLHGIHPDGLNMIPGGEAGLKFLATMTKIPVSNIRLDDIEGLLEKAINRNLRQAGLPTEKLRNANTNAALVALWRDNMEFRIRAITHHGRRLTFRQIQNARILHAAGWTKEKIAERLCGMDDRKASCMQIEQLLLGKTYNSIPHVWVRLDDLPAEPVNRLNDENHVNAEYAKAA